MNQYEMASHIANSNMDLNLKKFEILKMKNQLVNEKDRCVMLTSIFVLFGIFILPLVFVPFTLKGASMTKNEIRQIDSLLIKLS
ncbi:hypothetical protein QOZ84_11130 [Romboutsia sedimentorum]|uniref:Uncharacterized protein n=1 Tax=Romboutsia sedimentorum TaxID=1368474 RepID=A0ABT7EAZ3_9FIRM|nr:hypothetical protein [Romboutsia sedimentorum]MDK2564104.1 hypothetical protein [Romboutsia sedimentorum]